MSEYAIIFKAVLAITSLVGLGWILRWKKWLTPEADFSFIRVVVNVFYPCLIVESILGNQAMKGGNLWIAPLMGFGTIALGFALSFIYAKFLKSLSSVEKKAFVFMTGTYNFGYIPVPLAMALFDRETVGVLFLNNLGVEIAIWSVGLTILIGGFASGGWKKCLNGPVIAILGALTLNFFGLNQLPDVLKTAVHALGQCSIPMGLILGGAVMVDCMQEIRWKEHVRVLLDSVFLRILLLPILFLLAAKYLNISLELKRVLVLQSAMPTAVFPIVMTRHYGGDVGIAFRVVFATGIVSLVTAPLWIHAGLMWIKAG